MITGFEVTVDFHDSTSPRKRRFASYSDLAQYLERVPNMLGYLANQKATIVIESVQIDGATLFDLPKTA